MLYRLIVFWNYQRCIIILPGLLYLAQISISIPLLISETWPNMPLPSHSTYRTVFYSLSVSLNLLFTILICLRIFLMRDKAVKVLGKLQAFFYNSLTTMFVESGGFFTIWSIVYLITLLSNSWAQNVFLEPYSYILAITRTLIIIRMAQNRAWSQDIIAAAIDGELDWQISSTNTASVVFHNINSDPSISPSDQ